MKANRLKTALKKVNKLVKLKKSSPQVKSLVLEYGIVLSESDEISKYMAEYYAVLLKN
jgi:hypothetical protein